MDVSIIISTRNRATNLRQTLTALGKVEIPEWRAVELIVVDNASTDDTAAVVRNVTLSNMRVVYLLEPKKGKANALNAAVAAARGETLVFTDDDVAPAEDWIEQILLCFDETGCDALVGKITLAPYLERPWMGPHERIYLAVPDFESGGPLHWVGANAAFRRRCLQRVRQFDPELGPGALGYGEDTLFGRQLVEAGFKLQYAPNAIVVHHPDASRLTRGAWLHFARLHAKSEAYLWYHWEHSEIKYAQLKQFWFLTKLRLRRILQRPRPSAAEGCPHWEWSYEYDLAFYRQLCIEGRRSRNYPRRGLGRLDVSDMPATITAAGPASIEGRPYSKA